MLRVCDIVLNSCWNEHLPFIEFAYNNSYHPSIQMVPLRLCMGEDVDLSRLVLRLVK